MHFEIFHRRMAPHSPLGSDEAARCSMSYTRNKEAAQDRARAEGRIVGANVAMRDGGWEGEAGGGWEDRRGTAPRKIMPASPRSPMMKFQKRM
jgi:hypothetical protein